MDDKGTYFCDMKILYTKCRQQVVLVRKKRLRKKIKKISPVFGGGTFQKSALHNFFLHIVLQACQIRQCTQLSSVTK